MAADIFTIALACLLIICPGIAPVYDSVGLDTVEIAQVAEEISGVPIQSETQNTASGSQNAVQTPSPVSTPYATPYPQPSQTPVLQPTLSPTPVPTAAYVPTAAPAADKAGASLLSGTWYGSKSLFFGMAAAEFYLTADSNGKMKISGTANAPSAGYNNEPFSVDADWTYLGADSFVGMSGDKEIPFTCNGNQISLTANPYKLGLIDNSIANMDVSIQMERI
ncbi:MAG TPA: hypothetical protein O0X97_04790 [Methanocorpusculum sp.]|nr:hypothetical protein [Methanocorpusculum sp.]